MATRRCIGARAAVGLLAASLAFGCRATGIVALPSDDAAFLPPPPAFTLVTWNVQKGKHERLRSELGDLVARGGPLLVFLQEACADSVEELPLASPLTGLVAVPVTSG